MSINSVDVSNKETSWEKTVKEAVRALRYGSVEILVHDGRVVQVETREKVRFPEERPPDDRRRTPNDGRPDRKAGGATSLTDEEIA